MKAKQVSQVISEDDFWKEVRRGLVIVARAVAKRYRWTGLIILLGIEMK
jgi:hypothetical protein